MRFYVASSFSNHANVLRVISILGAAGHRVTYDWTVHGPVWRQGAERCRHVAHNKLAGVAAAGFVVVLLPGGRETHAELGAALALSIPVFLVSADSAAFAIDENTCAFYHALNVQHVVLEDLAEIANVIASANLYRDYPGEPLCRVPTSLLP